MGLFIGLVVFVVVSVIITLMGSAHMKKEAEAERVAKAKAEDARMFKDRKVICRAQDGQEQLFDSVEEVSAALGMSVPAVKVHIKDGKSFNWNDTWYQLSLAI